MPGVIVEILVRSGDWVKYGQPLGLLEAMKMRNILRSPRDGVIATVEVSPGQTAAHGQVLLTFEV
jgi:biotin carboxyl carrier protein